MIEYTHAELCAIVQDKPHHNISINSRQSNVDLAELQEHPILLYYANRVLSDNTESSTITAWNNFYNAYHELNNAGILQIRDTLLSDANAIRTPFVEKAEGPARIPLDELKGYYSVHKDKPIVDYVNLAAAIQSHYGFSHYGFFDQNRYAEMQSALKFNEDRFNLAMRTSPYEYIDAAKISVYSKANEFNEPPYVNFWHYHLATYFKGINKGSVRTVSLNKSLAFAIEYAEKNKIHWVNGRSNRLSSEFLGELFFLYSQIFIKELAQLGLSGRIRFLLDW